MKKTILLLILTIFSFNFLIAQQTISETEKLASLGKIYGFLKYYHPEIAQGRFDLDNQLIKQIPLVLKASDKDELSKVYLDWIDSFGILENCKTCELEKDSFNKNFNLFWLKDSLKFNNQLIKKLIFIEKNRFQGENYYAKTEYVGKIKITNEPKYENFEYPNQNYRLLGLFKYWNIVEYFFPYKYLCDENWDLVLLEMIPKFRIASSKTIYHNNIKEMVSKLDDSHAWIYFNTNEKKYLPVKVSHIENKPVIAGFYNKSIAKENNLELGDIILKINDLDLIEEAEKELKYISASNLKFKIKESYQKVLEGEKGDIKLTILRNNQIKEVYTKKYYFKEFNYWNSDSGKYKSLTDNIGYLNMAKVESQDISEIFKAFKNKKAIIIDLRNYPKFIYRYFTKYLNDEVRDFAKVYSPNINYPSKFLLKDNLQTLKSKKAYKGKVIILVNGETFSRAEFTVMAFQTANNAITIGNQTVGADGDVIVFEYLGGFKTAFSGNGILYPNGEETQRKGIKIDIKVYPTIKGLKQGRDELLEKAIEVAKD